MQSQRRKFGRIVVKTTHRTVGRNKTPKTYIYLECSYLTPVSDCWDEKYRGITGIPLRQYKTFPLEDRTSGEAWLNDAKKAKDARMWVPPQITRVKKKARQTPFRDYASTYIEHKRKRDGSPIAETTRDKYREYLAQVLPYLGSKPINAITRHDIQNWWDTFPIRTDKQGVHGDAQRAHIYSDLLKPIFTKAATEPLNDSGETLISHNPCTLQASRPRLKHVKRIATPSELTAIHAAMPDWIALAILFAGVMGLREGECVGLQRADIDLDRQQLTVKHSVKPVKDKHGKRKLLLGKPKTESSVRTLPIPEFLTPMVAAHLDRFTSARSDDMVFASPHTGGLVSGQTLRNLFYKARDAATPQLKGMSFHDLRDTALSHLAENGASLGTLMAQAGHTNINTAAIYQQPTEANQRKAYESLETQFEPTTDSKPVETDQNVDVLKLCAMLQALPLTVQADTLSALPTDVRAAVVMEMSKNE